VSARELPVTVAVTRPSGDVEYVRVGTAFDNGNGFTLRLGDLAIGPAPGASASAPRRSAPVGGGAEAIQPSW